MTFAITRRSLFAGSVALLASGLAVAKSDRDPGEPALRSLSSAPMGCCFTTADLEDAVFRPMMARHFSQATPGWEMKMARILAHDRSFRWDAADALVAFAEEGGMRFHGRWSGTSIAPRPSCSSMAPARPSRRPMMTISVPSSGAIGVGCRAVIP